MPTLRPMKGTYLNGHMFPVGQKYVDSAGQTFQLHSKYERSNTVYQPTRTIVPNEQLAKVKSLRGSSEGTVQVMRSTSSGSVFLKKTLHKHCHRVEGRLLNDPVEIAALKALTFELRHRHIVQFFSAGVGSVDPRAFLIEEYCEGGDLADQMLFWATQSNGRLPTAFICQTFVHVASGLAWLHHGIHHHRGRHWSFRSDANIALIHGDIKGENILLRWTAQSATTGLPDLVITDFGHTGMAGDEYEYLGTCDFQPPEVQANDELTKRYETERVAEQNPPLAWKEWIKSQTPSRITNKTDIYCFGQVMRMLLCPDEPIANTYLDLASGHIDHDFDVPALVDYVRMCLAPNPDERLPTIKQDEEHKPGKTGLQDAYCLLTAIDIVRQEQDELTKQPAYHISPNTWYRGPGVSMALLAKHEYHASLQGLDPNLNVLTLSKLAKPGHFSVPALSMTDDSFSVDGKESPDTPSCSAALSGHGTDPNDLIFHRGSNIEDLPARATNSAASSNQGVDQIDDLLSCYGSKTEAVWTPLQICA